MKLKWIFEDYSSPRYETFFVSFSTLFLKQVLKNGIKTIFTMIQDSILNDKGNASYICTFFVKLIVRSTSFGNLVQELQA